MMSGSAICLGSSLRLACHISSSCRSATAARREFRRFAHRAVQQEHVQRSRTFMSSEEPGIRSSESALSSGSRQRPSEAASSSTVDSQQDSTAQEQEALLDETGWSPDPIRRRPTDKRREEYFLRLFNPLKFPAELAHRTLTHNSHSMARQGHNAALAFIGRRVMAAYFMMFLHSSQNLKPNVDVEDITARSLNTHLLGEYVGNVWGVGRELVWAPSMSKVLATQGQLPGLYKVQGETVQAIMGAIYHQFGGVVTHRVFHLRLLPLLLIQGGVPVEFHQDVFKIFSRMGGKHGRLLPDKITTSGLQKRKVHALA